MSIAQLHYMYSLVTFVQKLMHMTMAIIILMSFCPPPPALILNLHAITIMLDSIIVV